MRAGAWAVVDLGAIRENVAWLRSVASPATVLAVVKADGYGHGSVRVAEAALAAGAEGLGVALVAEGAVLRSAGLRSPILLLSEPFPEEIDEMISLDLEPMVYSSARIADIGDAALRRGANVAVHLKIDTGMHRVGARPEDAVALASLIQRHPALRLAAVATHLAVADEPRNPYSERQLDRIDGVLRALDHAGIDVPHVHTANSAGTIAHGGARRDLVRVGIAMYGIAPSAGMVVPGDGLRPALSLRARVSYVKQVDAGEALSYGLRYRFNRTSTVATIPIGYADGVPRRLHDHGGEVLVNGRRRPIAGAVTMDQLMVDCGDDDGVTRGDEVVLIGRQGDDEITATEWAEKLGTIAYEIVCGISARVPRRYLG
ncbi:MAG: alanine racemase [Acidimicrobiia bacterium]